MRLLADMIRGQKVENVLAQLEHNPKHPAVPLRKLVLSAISNWKQKNEGGDESQLIIKTIFVDGARTIKRMRPAPQGRGYRVRKRSNHVTVIVDSKGNK
jgi:large subunit ribosomal protein L22